MSDSRAPNSIGPGTRLAGRFLLQAQLGAGAFGTVYSAQDFQHGGTVAIKYLTQVSGNTIYRFKREFRALADREHPNLIRFRELFSDGDNWFFSMDLVRGEPFDRYVLGPDHHPMLAPTAPYTPTGGRAPLPIVRPDLGRLRSGLAQLVAAVRALHAAGILHRDLKPANVLVTGDGRVVVLDFGLATPAEEDTQASALGMAVGTPSYMSPEQALGRLATEASDWYAVGIMLHEALYGRVPFAGTVQELISAKLSPSSWRWPPPHPGAEDLDQLCRALLLPEPTQRPLGDEIAQRVRARPFTEPARAPQPPPRPVFIGRVKELAALDAALQAVDRGAPVVMRVRGQSGVGKSALLQHFLRTLGPEAVTLQGRCFVRESVPYKSLDGIVDELTRHLGRLSVSDASLLVPREAQALCRLFPVFGRLRLLSDQPDRLRSGTPHEERRRGFAALREVLARIGDRRRLVVTIDDLQWGDRDSIVPLVELLARPDPPRLLLLLAYRSDAEQSSPTVRAIHQAPFTTAVDDLRDLEVGPLGDADTLTLVENLLPGAERARIEALARESGGIPIFVPELVGAAQQQSIAAQAVSLERAMLHRLSQLTAPARRLLEAVAVAGRPIARSVAYAAAQVAEADQLSAPQELMAERMLREAAVDDSALEPFHDRVRESVVAAMPPDRLKLTHQAVASALLESGLANAEALMEHYRSAGLIAEARQAAMVAAERAVDSFAFERAIALYRAAQEDAPSAELRLVTSKLADALAYAGRGRDAAAAYLEAVKGAPIKQQRELRRRAAEQLLRCGAVAEGIALARELLSEAGIQYPGSRTAVLASVGLQRALLSVRGISFTARSVGPEDDDAVSRADLCWTLGACLSPIDIIRGADYQTRHLRHALALGDPYRVSRGMALMSISFCNEGGRSHAWGEKLAQRAAEIARSIDHPHALGWSLSALSATHWSVARWRKSLQYSREAIAMFRARSPESVWEAALPEIMLTSRSLFFLGELDSFRTEAQRSASAAAERGDTLVVTMAQSVGLTKVHLIEGQPARARAASAESIARWVKGEWHLQHQEDLRAQLLCDLYEGDGARALERISSTLGQQQASMLLRAHTERVQSYSIFAGAAICARDAAATERWWKLLSRENAPWARAHTAAAHAGLLVLRGDDRAADAYERAAVEFSGLEMPLYAAAARRRRGELLGGDEGQKLVQAADAALLAQRVAEPARLARLLVQ